METFLTNQAHRNKKKKTFCSHVWNMSFSRSAETCMNRDAPPLRLACRLADGNTTWLVTGTTLRSFACFCWKGTTETIPCVDVCTCHNASSPACRPCQHPRGLQTARCGARGTDDSRCQLPLLRTCGPCHPGREGEGGGGRGRNILVTILPHRRNVSNVSANDSICCVSAHADAVLPGVRKRC